MILLILCLTLLIRSTTCFKHSSRTYIHVNKKNSNVDIFLSHSDDDEQQGSFKPIISIGNSIHSKMYDKLILWTALFGPIVLPLKSNAQGQETRFYLDKKFKYSIGIPPSLSIMEKATTVPAMAKFQSEQVLMTASTFIEASSLSITRTNAAQLLKDFEIDWWFSPLNSISDVGSAQLVAELLVLQRQVTFTRVISDK